ncbi:4'-phosphopantetheinyl transferase superfamily [Papiliotrema laurentii]|uniref:4'-phosphopantetheinyl transferase superfamily n=1 Tax=Papiliotrema laurentii TaxID=5418 RepID=A0AAD9L5Y6_PAPLA|nr:4'-phosphopantetheinyl transferase superfamily [Papiliotrema laurentii]
MLGLGVDILSLKRFEQVIRNRGFQRVARRVCCPRELADFERLSISPIPRSGEDAPSAKSIERGGTHAAGVESRASGVLDTKVWDRQFRFLSTRWAIKEAAYKAIYPSLPYVRTLHPGFHPTFHAFDLCHENNVPVLRVLRCGRSGTDGEVLPGLRLLSSVSHDAGVVVGVVVALQGETGPVP